MLLLVATKLIFYYKRVEEVCTYNTIGHKPRYENQFHTKLGFQWKRDECSYKIFIRIISTFSLFSRLILTTSSSIFPLFIVFNISSFLKSYRAGKWIYILKNKTTNWMNYSIEMWITLFNVNFNLSYVSLFSPLMIFIATLLIVTCNCI